MHPEKFLRIGPGVHGSAPGYLQNAICPVASAESQRHLSSASSADLIVPATPRSLQQWAQDRAFAVAEPRAWNSLPDTIRRSPSLAVFKRSLKTHFYTQCFINIIFITYKPHVLTL